MKDDNRFAIVGISQTIILLIVTSIASTSDNILTFLGVTVLIDAMCYVAHRLLNKKH